MPSTFDADKHLTAIGHHLNHSEAHQRKAFGEQNLDNWKHHSELADEHFDAATRHAKVLGLDHNYVQELRSVHASQDDSVLPSVGDKFVPHEHDSLLGGHVLKPAKGNYSFRIGESNPETGSAVADTSPPVGAVKGEDYDHKQALMYHANKAATAGVDNFSTRYEHSQHAMAHGAYLGISQGAVTSIIRAREKDPQPTSGSANFEPHVHDDKLNTAHHAAALKHHAINYTRAYLNSKPEARMTQQAHHAAHLGHNLMLGGDVNTSPYSSFGLGAVDKDEPASFKPHENDSLLHPSFTGMGVDKNHANVSALAHHIDKAAGHDALAEDTHTPPLDAALHRNVSESHKDMAIRHGNEVGLGGGDVESRMAHAAARGAVNRVVSGQKFESHPADFHLPGADPYAEPKGKGKPQHQVGMEHHINHMLAHHDRSLQHHEGSDERTHHIAQAQKHEALAYQHGSGAGLTGDEVEARVNEMAQQPHTHSVKTHDLWTPNNEDPRLNDADFQDRGATARQGRRFHTNLHSDLAANGHTNHQTLPDAEANKIGSFSRGTILADHPTYGRVRMKPASGIHGEYSGSGGAWSSAHRELAVHDAFHGAFGLGEHMHHVGLASRAGEDYSVHEQLHNHDTLGKFHNNSILPNSGLPTTKEALSGQHASGRLHQLATADYIVGNMDRHAANAMIHSSGGKNKPLQMIDHGLALPPSKHADMNGIPSYLGPFSTEYGEWHEPAKSQHGVVKNWLDSIPEDKLMSHFSKFSPEVQEGVKHRFKNAKAHYAATQDANDAVDHMYSELDLVPREKLKATPAKKVG